MNTAPVEKRSQNGITTNPGAPPAQRRGFSSSKLKDRADALAETAAQARAEVKEEKKQETGDREPETDKPVEEKKTFLYWVKYAARMFNPVSVYRRFREDLRAYREAKKEAKRISEESLVGKPELVKSVINLKMGASVAGSEIVGTYFLAPMVGGAFQVATGNAYWGILGTVIGDYFPAAATFQAIWLWLNLEYYSNCADTFWGKAKRFYKDVLPLHGAAVVASVPAYAVSSTLSAAAITGINAVSPGLADSLPMPLLSLLNIGVAEVMFLTLVGNMIPKLVERIADAYHSYIERRHGK